MNRRGKKSWRRPLLTFFGGIVGMSVLLRIFVFEIYTVSKDSMNNSYVDGDKVLVNKLKRRDIGRNDVVVFRHDKDVYIKRCIGLPGETIEIRNGQVYVDNKQVCNPAKIIRQGPEPADTTKGKGISNIVIFDLYGRDWTLLNFGPYLVPKKGMEVTLTAENIKLYRKLLPAEISGQSNGGSEKYIFKSDFFFLLGDNRPHSEDSRLLGAIDGEQIIGKVTMKF